jgi:hypothetical protein
MYLIEFVQDVLRFAKHGLLLRFCWLLFGRIGVLLCACVIGAMFEYASLPVTKVMVGVLAVFIAAWLRDVYDSVSFATLFRQLRSGPIENKS